MKGYRINAEVNVHDVDYNGIARASSILKYMQSAAQSQLTENGMSYDSLYGRRRAFILSRIRLEINCPLRADMPLTAITFPCESRGYSFLRCYALELDGVPVARAISMWALINTESRELIRVNDFELGLSTLPPIDMTVNRFRMMFTIPAMIMKYIGRLVSPLERSTALPKLNVSRKMTPPKYMRM